ncbi:aspartic peptidase domain-containing protein [Copromyces sp. CBS 386.78]|nr:aspartic peptidase domain-containing protein [Copromyces sp. CBS 386.78]
MSPRPHVVVVDRAMPFMTSSLVLALGAASVLAADCPSPLSFPITTKQIDPNVPDSFMRGIAVTIGTPEQTILVNAWPDLNNTYIYDQQMLCDPSIIFNDEICFVRRGGIYHYEDSKSFTKYNDLASAGGATNEITTTGTELGVKKLLSSSLAGVEKLSVGGSNTSSVTMPIGIPRLRWDGGYTILHALGLGANSTYLNALSQSNKIPSKVWSYFWGRQWGSGSPLDGSIVFGGYDQEKTIGNNYTQPLDYSESTGCWTGMKVTVSDLVLNYRNGDDESIMPRNSAIPVCIVPQRHLLLEAPGYVVDNFEQATGMVAAGSSFGFYWGAQVYNNTATPYYDGDLTIALSNGLSVRIPNSQLIVPPEEIARNGSFVTEPNQMALPINRLGTQPATLGRFFFTSAYLMVDHEADTFTLWQANPTAKSNLVAISHAKDSCASEPTDGGAANGTSGAGGSGSGSGGTNAPGSEAGEPTAKTPTGAIAGGVVGGVGALALIGAVAFFLVRRRKRTANNTQSGQGSTGDMSDGDASGFPLAQGVGELESHSQPQPAVGELPSSGNYKYAAAVGVQQYDPHATQQPSQYGEYHNNKPAEVQGQGQGWVYELDNNTRPVAPVELSGGTPRFS